MPAAGAIIGAVGSIGGAAMQSKAAGKAGAASEAGSAAATRTQWNMFKTNAELNDWQRVGGGRAYNEYMQMIGLAPVHIATANDILSPYESQYGQPAAATGGKGFDIFNPIGTHSRGGIGGAITLDPLGLFKKKKKPKPPTAEEIAAQQQAQQAATARNLANSPNAPGTPTAGYSADQVMARLQATPGYQMRAQEGNTQIEASAAARGGLNSGATLRALQRYGQDYNTNEFNNYLGRLSNLFGGAQSASNNLGAAAQNAGQLIGQNQVNAGNARADMYANRSNAMTGALSSLSNIFGRSAGYGRTGGTGGTGNGSYYGNIPGGGTGGGP